MSDTIKLRPEQAAIIEGYNGGKMGVSAVPGSGKTFTLSRLAARLVNDLMAAGVSRGIAHREVLVVTFTNTAVNTFRSRIAYILQHERGLLPYIGYRVRTLHGLAHDIVRERPALVGLAEDFQIVDERLSNTIIRDIAQSVLSNNYKIFDHYLDPEKVGTEKQVKRLQHNTLPGLATDLVAKFIKHAKNTLLTPEALEEAMAASALPLPLARFGAAAYEEYQRSLSYRAAVDFDDLVRLALVALREDPGYCERLRERWPYILEDEAQDSSNLQEDMLKLLSNDQNWVRVGDPNQAINTTFTTADPKFLRQFLQREDVIDMPLQTSGRSAVPVIDLANHLVHWTHDTHPVRELRDAFYIQDIIPTAADDPRPNPPADSTAVYVHAKPGDRVSPDQELSIIARSVEQFVRANPDSTVAVLAPANSRAEKFSEIMYEQQVSVDDQLLRTPRSTRETAQKFTHVMNYLDSPLIAKHLVVVYRKVWCDGLGSYQVDNDVEAVTNASRILAGCRKIEQLIWPVVGEDWLDAVGGIDADIKADIEAFRSQIRIWMQAVTLPVDQLVLTITQSLFDQPADIALGHKIAAMLRSQSQNYPDWRLSEFVDELRLIGENQRKFQGFDDVETGYEEKPGHVTSGTMHSAKGLEWDRVYLLGVSNYGFPSAQAYDSYQSEKWFVRDDLNLESELLAQLDALVHGTSYVEGETSQLARLDYAEERLRLLYVGITRAKRHVMLSWNMGRFYEKGGTFVNQPALPLVALWSYTQEGQ